MNPEASAMQVISTTAMQTTLEALAPSFERATGRKLAFSFGPSGRMAGLVAEGAPCDVAIVTAGGIDDLIGRGRIVAGSRADIARSMIGLAVPRGAARPDIASLAGLKQALLAARAIAMSHPTGGAQSGAHLAKVFATLGIADVMREKSIYGPGGPAGLIGNYLLRGEADIGLQQLPELLAVPGIDVIGPIPDEVQLVTVFSAGASTAAVDPAAAVAWIAHLRSADAAGIIAAKGMRSG